MMFVHLELGETRKRRYVLLLLPPQAGNREHFGRRLGTIPANCLSYLLAHLLSLISKDKHCFHLSLHLNLRLDVNDFYMWNPLPRLLF